MESPISSSMSVLPSKTCRWYLQASPKKDSHRSPTAMRLLPWAVPMTRFGSVLPTPVMNVKYFPTEGLLGGDGPFHECLESVALGYYLPHMQVQWPCDSIEANKATLAAIRDIEGPVITLQERAPQAGGDQAGHFLSIRHCQHYPLYRPASRFRGCLRNLFVDRLAGNRCGHCDLSLAVPQSARHCVLRSSSGRLEGLRPRSLTCTHSSPWTSRGSSKRFEVAEVHTDHRPAAENCAWKHCCRSYI